MTTPNEVGLDAVFKTEKFQAGLARYIAGQAQARASTQATAGHISSVGGGMASGFGAAISALSGPLGFISNLIGSTLGAAIGTLTGTLIPGLLSGLSDIASGAVSAVSELQLLTITLESLSAREIYVSGGAASMTDALAQAGPMADALLGSLRELSIISPFEYKDVVNVFRLNMAFGQSSETALELTDAILNMAAGMGLTGPFLERIAYNFSQMNLVGKITAMDMRQLGQAGIDLGRILREELGVSMEEANAKLQSGSITFKEISQAFVDYAEKNVGNAAQRASRSLSGLASSFRDLLFFASADLFGSAFGTIGDALGTVFDKANEFASSGVLQMVGAGLDVVAQQAVSAGGSILTWAGSLFDGLNVTFEDIAGAAFDWGANIVLMLAQGIIAGAAAVLDALLFIGNIIAAWLGPGSPPKIAPDLPEWGRAAMQEFLGGFALATGESLQKAAGPLEAWGDTALNALFKGFSSADFDIFDSLLGPLEQALGVMQKLGDVTEAQVRETLGSISEVMAQALAEFEKTGQVGPEVFDAIRAAGGELGDELADLLQKQLDLAAGVKKVEAAEKALDEARQRQEQATQDVSDLTSEYNRMLRAGASDEALRLKLAEINAAEQARGEAAGQADEAERALEAEKERQKALQESVKLQEELLRQLIELARQQIPPKEGEETGGGGGGGGGIEPPEFAPPEIPGVGQGLGEIEKKAAAFKERIEKLFEDLWSNIAQSIEDSEIAKKWEELTKEAESIWNEVWPVLETKWAGFWSLLDIISGIVQPKVSQNIQDIGIDLQDIASKLPPVGDVFATVFGIMGIVAGFWGMQIAAVSNGIATAIDYIRTAIDAFAPLWGWLHDAWGDASWIEKIGLAIAGVAITIAEVLTIALYGIAGYIKGWVLGVVGFFTDLYNKLVGRSVVPEMMDAIYNTITGILTSTVTWVGTKLGEMVTAFTTKFTEITTGVTTGAQTIYDTVTGKITELSTAWGTAWGTIRDTLGGIWTEITTAAATKIGEVLTTITTGLDDTLTAIGLKVITFYNAGADLIGGMVQGVLDGVQYLIDAVVQAIKDAIEAARKFLGAESPAKLTMELGVDAMAGFALGMETEGQTLADALTAALVPLERRFSSLPAYAGGGYAPAPMMSTSTTTYNYYTSAPSFDFGRNNINSPALAAASEARVRRIVREELRRR